MRTKGANARLWDVAGFVELWDPECEFFTLTGSQLAGAPYRGHDGLRRYCEERAEISVS